MLKNQNKEKKLSNLNKLKDKKKALCDSAILFFMV